jgi:hypothetical protein
MVGELETNTPLVLTVKLAVVEPAVTFTLDGTAATAGLLLNRATESPAGAGPVRVTVPVDTFPPITLVGFREKDASAGGLTVSVAV